MKYHYYFIYVLIHLITSCNQEDLIVDDGNGISINFLEGLNDNPNFSLLRNSSGFYELSLDTTRNQTIQRLTGVLLRQEYY